MISDAIQSALRQTYQYIDVWVIDNCSTDETEQVVQKLILQDSRVKYVRQPHNIGMPGNFNTCLASARGEFMLILCSDDVLEAGCVAALVSALVSHPSSVLAACARTFVNAKLVPLRVVRPRPGYEVIDGLIVSQDCIARGNRIGEPSAVLFRREEASRGFNPNYNQLLDLEMWMHLMTKGSAVFVPEPLCQIRQHSEQATISNFRSGRLIDEKRRLFRGELSGRSVSLPFSCKVRWDIRMVGSIARVRLFGGQVNAIQIIEVFYRPIFLTLVLILNVSWPLVRRWILKSRRQRFSTD